jgi:hypothetical protein
MPQFNEFRCEGCDLYFVTDLEAQDIVHCPLCGHRTPEQIKTVEVKNLCEECAGTGKRMTAEELDQLAAEAEAETADFLNSDEP